MLLDDRNKNIALFLYFITHKEDHMKNISLIKVTFVVIATALASPLVSAEDVMPKVVEIIPPSAAKNIQFDELDLDKNGLLSLIETEKHKEIHDAFTKIDLNSDATISKDEFIKYVTK